MTAHLQNLDALPVSFRSGSQWYCVRTNIKSESRAVQSLKEQGFDTFLPLAKKWIVRARKKKERDLPLYSRYLFVRVNPDMDGFYKISTANGVEGLLSNCGIPSAIPDADINDLRAQQGMGLWDETTQVLRMEPGSLVKLIRGPLSNCVGVLERAISKKLVEVRFRFFGRETLMKISLANLRPA